MSASATQTTTRPVPTPPARNSQPATANHRPARKPSNQAVPTASKLEATRQELLKRSEAYEPDFGNLLEAKPDTAAALHTEVKNLNESGRKALYQVFGQIKWILTNTFELAANRRRATAVVLTYGDELADVVGAGWVLKMLQTGSDESVKPADLARALDLAAPRIADYQARLGQSDAAYQRVLERRSKLMARYGAANLEANLIGEARNVLKDVKRGQRSGYYGWSNACLNEAFDQMHEGGLRQSLGAAAQRPSTQDGPAVKPPRRGYGAYDTDPGTIGQSVSGKNFVTMAEIAPRKPAPAKAKQDAKPQGKGGKNKNKAA